MNQTFKLYKLNQSYSPRIQFIKTTKVHFQHEINHQHVFIHLERTLKELKTTFPYLDKATQQLEKTNTS